MQVELVKSYRIEAAHDAPCGGVSRLHGHSFAIDIVASGECDPNLGWLIDYGDISNQFDDLFKTLDHRTLNSIDGMRDGSVADLRRWILERLQPRLQCLKTVRVSIVGPCRFAPERLAENEFDDLTARVRFGFEAAHALPRLPQTHKCHRMHGHSFTIEVARDGADPGLETELRRIYDDLDHRCLNDVPGLENPTSEMLSRWIWDRLGEIDRATQAVIVAETCTARCVYHGK